MSNPLITPIRIFRREASTGIAIGKPDIGTERATPLELRIILFLDGQQFLHECRFLLGGNVLAESNEGCRFCHLSLPRLGCLPHPRNNIDDILVEPAVIQEEDVAHSMFQVKVG